MKSYNHLFEKIIDVENIRKAIHQSSKRKKTRREVQQVLNNEDYYIQVVRYLLINDKFNIRKHVPKIIDDGFQHKQRKIIQPDYKYEQIVQHALMQVLIPIFKKGMYEYCCGSIPKRGNSHGKKYIEKVIKKDKVNTKYVLKIDIKKFFDNIDHDILKNKLKRIIHDEKTLNLLYKIIDSYDKGLPLGYFTSQWLANFYLQDLDYFIKQTLGIKYYVRYMDDMVLFASNKEELHYARKAIENYIATKLNLKLKHNYQVFRIANNKKDNARCLNFMGYKFYMEKTILRKNIMLKTTRKIRKILKKKKCTWYDATQLMSYYGWIKHTNSYTFFTEFFTDNKLYINELKKKVSNHQKYLNMKEEQYGLCNSC